jgi:predicted DsbA family dithiol-disulfide isomerase
MAMPAGVLTIEMVSDVVCPWCFIGKRRLEKAIALNPEFSIVMHYRPYLLNPWVPRNGINRDEYLMAKFGSVERYRGNAERVVLAAREEGLVYDVDAITRQPNTIDCHRLICWADENGSAGRMKQRLMTLFFSEGADLSDTEVLVSAAQDCAMDADRVRRRLESDEDIKQVVAEAEATRQAGIDGVPCFIFNGVIAISGAQSPDHLTAAMERAARHAVTAEEAVPI